MKYIVKTHLLNIPDKVLLADLRRTARKLKKKHVGLEEYRAEGNYSASIIEFRFGGWNGALIKAGLKVKKIYRIPDDDLMLNLKRVWDKLGRQPGYMHMETKVSLYYPSTYARRWGSWQRALYAFSKWYNEGKYKPKYKSKNLNFMNTGSKKKLVTKITLHVNKSMRFDVLRRDNYRCKLCGASPATDPKVKLHVDHIIPASKGGKSILTNLQTLCSDCNLGKGVKTAKPS